MYHSNDEGGYSETVYIPHHKVVEERAIRDAARKKEAVERIPLVRCSGMFASMAKGGFRELHPSVCDKSYGELVEQAKGARGILIAFPKSRQP